MDVSWQGVTKKRNGGIVIFPAYSAPVDAGWVLFSPQGMQRAAPADQMTVEQVNINVFFTAEVTKARRGFVGRAPRPILESLRDLRALRARCGLMPPA